MIVVMDRLYDLRKLLQDLVDKHAQNHAGGVIAFRIAKTVRYHAISSVFVPGAKKGFRVVD